MDDKQIHVRWFLTNDIIIDMGDGTFDVGLNGDYWVMCARVVITKSVEERIDKSAGPAYFVGYFLVESKPMHVYEIAPKLQALKHEMEGKIREIAAAGNFKAITNVPNRIKL